MLKTEGNLHNKLSHKKTLTFEIKKDNEIIYKEETNISEKAFERNWKSIEKRINVNREIKNDPIIYLYNPLLYILPLNNKKEISIEILESRYGDWPNQQWIKHYKVNDEFYFSVVEFLEGVKKDDKVVKYWGKKIFYDLKKL